MYNAPITDWYRNYWNIGDILSKTKNPINIKVLTVTFFYEKENSFAEQLLSYKKGRYHGTSPGQSIQYSVQFK